jgi:hypothetical protein
MPTSIQASVPGLNYDGIVFVKKTGTFTTSDNDGTWKFVVESSSAVSYGTHVLSSGGTTSCTWTERKADGSTTTTSCTGWDGNVILNSAGGLSGALTRSDTGVIYTIRSGQMSAGESVISLACATSTGQGEYLVAVKAPHGSGSPHDFNSDGKPDILWRNTATGQNAVWYMNGVTFTSGVLLPTR